MTDRDWWLRVRAVLSTRGTEVAALLVVLALVGGWVTYTTHVAPETTTEERVVGSWSRTAEFGHGATVRNPNPVFEEGERLSNRSVYFTRVSPVLDGNYTLEYAATDDERLDATVRLGLVVQGVTGEGGEEVLWRSRTTLDTRSASDLRPGETLRVPFSLSVPEVRNRTDEITSTLGTTGETEVFVLADVRLQRSGAGGTDERTFQQELLVVPEQDVYRVEGDGPSSEQFETTETVQVKQAYGLPRTVGGPFVLLVAVLGLVALGIGYRRDEFDLSDQEREWLAYRSDRTEFDEWIHAVQLPSEAYDLPRARADSLAALVDFAIDTDRAVVEPPDGDVFYVVHDGYLYTYTAPLPPDWNEAGQVDRSPTTLTGESQESEIESKTD
jgi:hypothetical protein